MQYLSSVICSLKKGRFVVCVFPILIVFPLVSKSPSRADSMQTLNAQNKFFHSNFYITSKLNYS